MDKSLKPWTCGIPFLLALVAVCAGPAGAAFALTPSPDPAPGVQVSPRPDAATTGPHVRITPRRSSSNSVLTRTPAAPKNSTRAGTGAAKGSGATSTTTPAPGKSTVAKGSTPPVASGPPAPTRARASGRDDRLLAGAALALGTLALAGLGLLGLIRRLQQQVALR